MILIEARHPKTQERPKRYRGFKVSELEFDITTTLIEAMDIEYEDNYTLEFQYWPISYGGYPIHYAENYEALVTLPRTYPIFRPFKTDKHANVLIDMFEGMELIEFDNLTTMEYIDKYGNKSFKGYFTLRNKALKNTYTYGAPSPAILKCMMVGKLILGADEYREFMQKVSLYSKIFRRNHRQEIVENEQQEVQTNEIPE